MSTEDGKPTLLRIRYIVDGRRPLCFKCKTGTLIAARFQLDDRPFDTIQCQKCGWLWSKIEIDTGNFVEWVTA